MTRLLVDYSMARPTPTAIKAAGYAGAIRYLSSWTQNPKNVGRGEVDALHAEGLAVGLVWEDGGNEMGGGPSTGAMHGQRAATQSLALGAPSDVAVYFAVDTDAFSPSVVVGYFRGVVGSMAGRPVGVYGPRIIGEAVLAAGLASLMWQTEAWGGQEVSPMAHLYQRAAPTRMIPTATGGYDENVWLREPAGMWLLQDAHPDVPTPVKPAPAPKPAPDEIGAFVASLPVVKQGASGQVVSNVQALLTAHRIGVTVDGAFGPMTAAAVRNFQQLARLDVDGIVGPQTWRALVAA